MSGIGRSALPRPVSTPARRATWSVLDQGLSSLSNFGISLIAAHELSGRQFGSFTLAFYAYLLAIGFSFALGGEPFQIRHSHVPVTAALLRARQAASGVALAVSFVAAAILVSVGFAVPAETRGPLIVIGFAMPGLLLQDAARQFYFADRQSSWAAFNDAIWVLSSALGAAVLFATDSLHSATALSLVWALGAWVGAIFALVHLRLAPRIDHVAQWLRGCKSMAISFSADFATMTGAGQMVVFLLPAIVSLESVGHLRGAQLLFGPLAVVLAGSRIFGIPEGARLLRDHPATFRRFEFIYGAVLTLAAAAYSLAVILSIPNSFGRYLLGSNWPGAAGLLVFTAVGMIGIAMAVAPFQGLRILSAGRRILKARAWDAPATLVLSVGGAFLYGVRGAVLGMGLANIVASVAWWYQFLKAQREHRADPVSSLVEEAASTTSLEIRRAL